MRAIARISGVITAVTLTALLAACGGAQSQTSSTSSTTSVAAQAAPPVMSTSLPTKPVCEVFSKNAVSQIIGKTVYSVNDVDISAGAQPTVCFYYTDTQEVNNVEIHWMLVKDAIWDTQIAALGTTESGGMKSTSVRYAGLGDDAIRGVTTFEGRTVNEYEVLLKQRGVVLDITNSANLPDGAFLNLVKMVIQTVNKL